MKSDERRSNLETKRWSLCLCIPIVAIIIVVLLPEATLGQITPTTKSDRFKLPTTRIKTWKRTTPKRMEFVEKCYYLAYYCLHSYKTGVLCGVTINYRYYTFKNYCMMDYVNCMEGGIVWQVAHMGECFYVPLVTDYMHYEYMDDVFLDHYYVIPE